MVLPVLELLKPRAKRLSDFAALGDFFFSDALVFDEAAVEKHLRADGMAAHLAAIDEVFASLPSFDAAAAEAALRATADARGVKAGALIHAVRVALTGRTVSPGLFEVAALVGPERTHRRLQAAIASRGSPFVVRDRTLPAVVSASAPDDRRCP